jgi:hypothetical protein
MSRRRVQPSGDVLPPGGIVTRPAGAGLRAQLRQVEARLGLLDAAAVLEPGNRFRGAALLPANAPLPPMLRALFPEELGELERLGKSTARCHARDMAGYRLFALPYYFYDGFNALLAVERDGDFVTAWRDSEAHQSYIPRQVHVGLGEDVLERFLREVLGAL